MKKIINLVRTDGLLHIETSALLVLALSAMLPLWAAASATMGRGIGKELYDLRHEGHAAEWHDILCDAVCIALGSVILVLMR